MNDGTQNITSVLVAMPASITLRGVGIVGMVFGSNALRTKPQDA
jgi:hypothetical protein